MLRNGRQFLLHMWHRRVNVIEDFFSFINDNTVTIARLVTAQIFLCLYSSSGSLFFSKPFTPYINLSSLYSSSGKWIIFIAYQPLYRYLRSTILINGKSLIWIKLWLKPNMDYTQSYLRDRWEENQIITVGTLNQKITLGTLNQKIVEAKVKSISIGHIYMTSNIVL